MQTHQKQGGVEKSKCGPFCPCPLPQNLGPWAALASPPWPGGHEVSLGLWGLSSG